MCWKVPQIYKHGSIYTLHLKTASWKPSLPLPTCSISNSEPPPLSSRLWVTSLKPGAAVRHASLLQFSSEVRGQGLRQLRQRQLRHARGHRDRGPQTVPRARHHGRLAGRPVAELPAIPIGDGCWMCIGIMKGKNWNNITSRNQGKHVGLPKGQT